MDKCTPSSPDSIWTRHCIGISMRISFIQWKKRHVCNQTHSSFGLHPNCNCCCNSNNPCWGWLTLRSISYCNQWCICVKVCCMNTHRCIYISCSSFIQLQIISEDRSAVDNCNLHSPMCSPMGISITSGSFMACIPPRFEVTSLAASYDPRTLFQSDSVKCCAIRNLPCKRECYEPPAIYQYHPTHHWT